MSSGHTYNITFPGITTKLTHAIDWDWWENSQVAFDPINRKKKHGSVTWDQWGLDPYTTKLSSNTLVHVTFDLWLPNKGFDLADVKEKVKWRAGPSRCEVLALGVRRPSADEPQYGAYLVEMTPGSEFVLTRTDQIQDEIRRYVLRWDSLFSRCRLTEYVDKPEPLVMLP